MFLLKFYLQKICLTFLYIVLFFRRRKDTREWIFLNRIDRLGDNLCTLSAVKHILDFYHHEGYPVAVLTDPANRWFFQRLFDFDCCIPVKCMQTFLHYRLAVFQRLYAFRIRKIIDFLANDDAGYLIAFSFAKEKYFQIPDQVEPPFWARKYGACCEHIISIPMEPIQSQGEKFVAAVTGQPVLPVEKYDFRTLFADLPSPGKEKGIQKYFVLLPGASHHANCWPPECFAELLNRLTPLLPEYTAVILGSQDDARLEARLLAARNDQTMRILTLCGKTSQQELFAWIRDAAFAIGNDSGGIHVAAAFRTTAFAVVSGIDLYHFLPNREYENVHCIYHPLECAGCWGNCRFAPRNTVSPYPCLESIAPDEVFQRISEVLLPRCHSPSSEENMPLTESAGRKKCPL